MAPNLLIRPGKLFLCFTIRLRRKSTWNSCRHRLGTAVSGLTVCFGMLLRLRLFGASQGRPSRLAFLLGLGGRSQGEAASEKPCPRPRFFPRSHRRRGPGQSFAPRSSPSPVPFSLPWLTKGSNSWPRINFRNAAPVVAYANLDSAVDLAQSHMDAAAFGHNRLAGVQQQIIESALQLLGIKPSRTAAFLADSDTNRVELRMRTVSPPPRARPSLSHCRRTAAKTRGCAKIPAANR